MTQHKGFMDYASAEVALSTGRLVAGELFRVCAMTHYYSADGALRHADGSVVRKGGQ